jgi:putative flippase GtrA
MTFSERFWRAWPVATWAHGNVVVAGTDLTEDGARVDLIRDVYTRFRVLIHEVMKFGIIGALAFAITVGGANILRSGMGLGPLTSVTIATVIATVFSFFGNKHWTFKHRKGNGLGRESALFFFFNGIGLLIQLAFVAAAHYGLGLTDTFSYNVANISGIIVATIFRLYTYRRWVFTAAEAAPPAAEQLEPETTGT